MFPKGPRFPAAKASEVPGPNTYNIPDDQLEAYKKGAFLEKTNRFLKEEVSDEPAPGDYNTNVPQKRIASNTHKSNSSDIALKRKFEDLERQYTELKKASRAEIDRLKQDLSRMQLSYSEVTEKYDKLSKRAEILEGRIQENRKSALSDQAELKELRSKLKQSEQERAMKASKQLEAEETKKALHALDGRRKEELREKDSRITELEKSLSGEQKKRRILETQLVELKAKDTDSKTAKQETRQALEALETLKSATAEKEEELVSQLKQHQDMLCQVAQEYGRLASSCVSSATHVRLKHERTALQLRNLRLERKLANSEGQVAELAHLIRSVIDQNSVLNDAVSDCYAQDQCFTDSRVAELPFPAHSVEKSLLNAVFELQTYNADVTDVHSCINTNDDLQAHLDLTDKQHAQLTTALKSRDDAEIAQREAEESRSRMRAGLRKEELAVQRLTEKVQKAKIVEDGLRVELAQLGNDLSMAENYRDAYNALYEEASNLVARNELAETEAERLSKINAEMIGHTNPAQKILYLEKIRQELAEVKHNLLIATRERGAAVEDNGRLRNELDLYKSVSVPVEDRPRTTLIRVGRPPLVNLNSDSSNVPTSIGSSRSSSLREFDDIGGMSKISEISNGWSIAEEDATNLSEYLPDNPDMTMEELL